MMYNKLSNNIERHNFTKNILLFCSKNVLRYDSETEVGEEWFPFFLFALTFAIDISPRHVSFLLETHQRDWSLLIYLGCTWCVRTDPTTLESTPDKRNYVLDTSAAHKDQRSHVARHLHCKICWFMIRKVLFNRSRGQDSNECDPQSVNQVALNPKEECLSINQEKCRKGANIEMLESVQLVVEVVNRVIKFKNSNAQKLHHRMIQ